MKNPLLDFLPENEKAVLAAEAVTRNWKDRQREDLVGQLNEIDDSYFVEFYLEAPEDMSDEDKMTMATRKTWQLFQRFFPMTEKEAKSIVKTDRVSLYKKYFAEDWKYTQEESRYSGVNGQHFYQDGHDTTNQVSNLLHEKLESLGYLVTFYDDGRALLIKKEQLK